MIRFLLVLLFSYPVFGEEISDPFEDLNRDIFIFNEKLDETLLRPAAIARIEKLHLNSQDQESQIFLTILRKLIPRLTKYSRVKLSMHSMMLEDL